MTSALKLLAKNTRELSKNAIQSKNTRSYSPFFKSVCSSFYPQLSCL